MRGHGTYMRLNTGLADDAALKWSHVLVRQALNFPDNLFSIPIRVLSYWGALQVWHKMLASPATSHACRSKACDLLITTCRASAQMLLSYTLAISEVSQDLVQGNFAPKLVQKWCKSCLAPMQAVGAGNCEIDSTCRLQGWHQG